MCGKVSIPTVLSHAMSLLVSAPIIANCDYYEIVALSVCDDSAGGAVKMYAASFVIVISVVLSMFF